ncbi:MAG: WYL domain-containing protein [Polyangiaceae bacterium]|jgi:predicted DNA-binding transcriptional regulator YafY
MPLRPFPRPKVPRVGRPTGKFTQHRRLDFLRERLEAHAAGLTLEDLAGMLRVTTRSVRRYMHELGLLTEVESVEVRPGGAHVWRIKPSERGRTVALRRTQAYALLAGRRVFEVLRGSALFDEIELTFREVEQVAHRPLLQRSATTVRPPAGDVGLEDRFAYVPPLPTTYANRSEDIDAVFQAVAELTTLRFRYREETGEHGTGGGKGARITAQPYALVLHGGSITCLARDVDRAAVRPFVFDRINDLEVLEAEHFELPADFALTDWLQGDFGVARAGAVKVLVEFEARAATTVRARKVHPSQKVALAPDGRVRVSLSVPDTPEVLARVRTWVLGFGASAHLIEPRELATELAVELRRAASRYGA